MKEYLVIFEWAGSNYSAYVPDLPGCISTGKTIEDTERNIQEAIELYIDTLKEDNQPIPESSSIGKAVAVSL
jgi:predicted RNase H-like HicB family nuclease